MSVPLYTPRVDRAVAYALDAFRDKSRKGSGAPYVTHLLSVMALVGEFGGDEDQLIAAVLHDLLEDIPWASAEALEAEFGPRVRRLVVALSDSLVAVDKAPWEGRKARYLAKLQDEPGEVKLVSAADKLHNCRSILTDHRRLGEAIFDRFTPTKDRTVWYYREVVRALGTGWDHEIHEELTRSVRELHDVAGLSFEA